MALSDIEVKSTVYNLDGNMVRLHKLGGSDYSYIKEKHPETFERLVSGGEVSKDEIDGEMISLMATIIATSAHERDAVDLVMSLPIEVIAEMFPAVMEL